MSDQDYPLADFLFEASSLSRTPRSFTTFFGGEHQSVADHVCRMMFIVYVLAKMDGHVDISKCLQMCLFHDLAEVRTGDLNYVNQPYVKADEDRAMYDITAKVPFRQEILDIDLEYHQRQSAESRLVKDADNLEWLMTSKERAERGNARSAESVKRALERLKTEPGKKLGQELVVANSWEWWERIRDFNHQRRLVKDEK